MAGRDLLTKLADAGEEAISKLGESPGADRFMNALGGMRERIDELQKKVRGIDDLERRVAALEARLAEPPAKRTTRSRTARKPAASKTSKTGSRAKPSGAKSTEEPSSSAKTGGESPG
jgi:phage shock protein A